MSTETNTVPQPPKEAEALPLPDSPEATDNTTVVDKDTVIVFHNAADMTLNVKGSFGAIEYKVSGMNLATASDVLRAIIFGKDGEKKPTTDVNVDLDIGEVDLTALKTLLHIAHFDFAKVPRELSLEDLNAVASLTSKYQCTGLVMPWASEWLRPFARLHKDESAAAVNHKAAFVAWEFGDAKLLRNMIKSLTMSTKVDADGDLVNATGTKLKDLVLPAGILDEITAIRTETIEKILTAIEDALENVSDNVNGQTSEVKFCKTGVDADKCEVMMFGSAVTQLLSAGLFPVPNAAQYKGSIANLVSGIEGIVLQHWEGKNYAPHASHTGCNLRFKENTKAAVKGMADPLKEAHIEHLKKQSAASGVNSHIDDHGDNDDADEEAPARRTKVTDTISGTGELLERSRSTSPKSAGSSNKNSRS
ncbi:hypothetical protein PG993_011531 [Apiospora rasikravindrae]|uniref:BTB domain-containing protein n=1 Tax=Apiospora rasikravindrae TaxID=990691 RepID=A0ABR1SFT8_9PEZI